MGIDYNFPTTGINRRVKDALLKMKDLSGKTVVDFPAGDGRSSFLLLNQKAKVLAFDLFPEFFKLKNMSCSKIDASLTPHIS